MENTTLLPDDARLERDDATGVYRMRYDWSRDESVSTVVVAAVAAVADTDPLELDPLRDALDPDALDSLFAPTPGGHPRDDGRVVFSLADHQVLVSAGGVVEIHPPE